MVSIYIYVLVSLLVPMCLACLSVCVISNQSPNHSVHWGLNPPPPQKHHHSFLLSLTPLNQKTVQAPLFGAISRLYIGFSWNPLKSQIFPWNPKILKFFSSLTPSYLLQVTKFFVKIFYFEFFVMTEKNGFAYKRFLSLNISDFNFFCVWKLQPLPWKKSPPSLPVTPSKNHIIETTSSVSNLHQI